MRGRLVLASVVLAWLPGGPVAAGESVRLADAGWWYDPSGSPLADLPVPVDDPLASAPVAEPGELVVAAADGRASAIAAVRFEVPAGGRAGDLALPVVRAEGSGRIVACVAGSGWTGADAGEWSDKPLADCKSGSAVASPVSDGALTIDASRLQVARAVDVVLVASEDADLEVVLARPKASHLSATVLSADARQGVAAPAPALAGTTGPDPTPPPAALPVASPPPEIALPVEDTGRSATSPIERAASEPLVDPGPLGGDGGGRATSVFGRAVAALVAVASLAYWIVNRRGTPLVGPRGLGDFRVERTDAPVALR